MFCKLSSNANISKAGTDNRFWAWPILFCKFCLLACSNTFVAYHLFFTTHLICQCAKPCSRQLNPCYVHSSQSGAQLAKSIQNWIVADVSTLWCKYCTYTRSEDLSLSISRAAVKSVVTVSFTNGSAFLFFQPTDISRRRSPTSPSETTPVRFFVTQPNLT